MSLATIFAILLTFTFTENYALIEGLGTGAVIENERSKRRSLIIGGLTTLVMVVTTAITWVINHYLLTSVPYLQTLVFVVVLLVVVELVHLVTKKHLEPYCKVDFLKFAINGAVLGLCIHNTEPHLTYLEALLTAFAVGLGLTLTMVVFSSLQNKIDEEAVPASFRGLPLALLIVSLYHVSYSSFLISWAASIKT